MLLLPPWRRAPLLPFGQPAVILAVVAATAILACAAASAALFLSSASSASLQRLIGAECPGADEVELHVDRPRAESTLTPRVGSRWPGSGCRSRRCRCWPGTHLLGDRFRPEPGADDLPDRGAGQRHGSPARRAPGRVAAEAAADRAGLRVGDRVPVGAATVPVAGVFRNLFQEPPRPYWCSYRQLIFNLANEDRDPPPLALASDPAVLLGRAGPHHGRLPLAVAGRRGR